MDISKNTSLRPGRPVRQTHLTHRTSIANQDAPGAHLTLRTQPDAAPNLRTQPDATPNLRTQPDAAPNLRTQPDAAPNPQDATRGST